MDRMMPKDCETMEENSKEAIVNEVVRLFTSGPKAVRNHGRRKLPSVPIDHCGPVPNVPVGTCWKYRWQVSEDGVHRPTVAGIHGRGNKGAYSIVLSGVYEDDKDFGDFFFYSGCGGKESDKSKRLAPQVYDQQLTRHNRGLALCCQAPVNDIEGGDAREKWRDGKPVRVVRKHSKFSEFAPKEGFRYDGIYKVAKYYPVMNHRTGLRVWTFELRRDDESPAPWTLEGIKNIEKLNLQMMVPELETHKQDKYMCSQVGSKIVLKKRAVIPSRELRRRTKSTTLTSHYDLHVRIPPEIADVKPNLQEFAFASGANIPWALTSSQQYSLNDCKPTLNELTAKMEHQSTVASTMDIDEDMKPNIEQLNLIINTKCDLPIKTEHFNLPVIGKTASLARSLNSDGMLSSLTPSFEISNRDTPLSNLLKISPRKNEPVWDIPQELHNLIERDISNKHTWAYLKSIPYRTKDDFLNRVKIMFSCPVCSNVVQEPISTHCQHNICLYCLEENFRKLYKMCPYCNAELQESIKESGSNVHLTNILNFLF